LIKKKEVNWPRALSFNVSLEIQKLGGVINSPYRRKWLGMKEEINS